MNAVYLCSQKLLEGIYLPSRLEHFWSAKVDFPLARKPCFIDSPQDKTLRSTVLRKSPDQVKQTVTGPFLSETDCKTMER